ncbi:serine hydrolase [Ornithinimicrobium sp. INDO-MA30-4]|uniref:serine hydrolase domain-containing protein n=1 Tax=Ornithinimicrobium sp. INDO-MA30-4 TaxID=2908651 RepID=UPI001F3A057D|nr:serine hydrolase [Ornithinimicrobium sp. INDO-MA30-4]UJH70336.1 beta-lactamase family protein [Ornithinimicrobium sp. INDO-MA30-4]
MSSQTPEPEAQSPDATTTIFPSVTAWADVADTGRLLPQRQPLVTLANWQTYPALRWSFQHMREIMPSHVIDGSDAAVTLPSNPMEFGELETGRENYPTVDALIEGTQTDAFLVLRDGKILDERYFGDMSRRKRHLVMSMSKSIVSCVTASLAADGILDPEASVETYVPEMAQSGYAGARVRDLLDMRSGIRFRETYLDPESEVRIMERSMGWAPRGDDDPLGMYPFILSCTQEKEHGGIFEYRSVETDALGWVCERASGMRMADLISERIWVPMAAFHDAEVSVDPLGSAIHDGGVSATLRDMARFGQMLLHNGRAGDRRVVPQWWIDTIMAPPGDVREAFAASDNEPYLPGGWYRNQFWVVPGDNGPIMLALGIHGQMVFVEQSTGTVGVKLSSWPLPQDADKLVSTIEAFRSIARHLASQD